MTDIGDPARSTAPVRRPGILTAIAGLAFLAAIAYALLAVLFAYEYISVIYGTVQVNAGISVMEMVRSEFGVRTLRELLTFAMLAMFRFLAGRGLLRVEPRAWLAESLYSLGLVGLGLIVAWVSPTSWLWTWLVIAVVSVLKLGYLFRPSVRALFRRPAPPSAASRVAVAAATTVVLAVVSWYGISGAIDESEHARRKVTMADMRTLATALEARASDTNDYPKVATVAELAPFLVPTYVAKLPLKDGWGNSYRYATRPQKEGPSYRLGSAAKSGQWEHESMWDYTKLATTQHQDDIVWGDGEFIRYPEATSWP